MVCAWQEVKGWSHAAGLEWAAEPWSLVVARLSDSGALEAVMQTMRPIDVRTFSLFVFPIQIGSLLI